jgi:hypothetical protein
MKEDNNVIEFAAIRGRAITGDGASPNAHRNKDPDALLGNLRNKKRLGKSDQLALVSNLGRLIVKLDGDDPRGLAKKILSDHWAKRKRYIRFPNEIVDRSTRCAASGGEFAWIIEQLINEKVSRRFDRDRAKIETVRDALKGTSFQPPSRFQMPADEDDADAAYFVLELEKVLDKLAEVADLPEHFKLVSKHPIYPDGPYYAYNDSLELVYELEPNNLHSWEEWYDDDD